MAAHQLDLVVVVLLRRLLRLRSKWWRMAHVSSFRHAIPTDAARGPTSAVVLRISHCADDASRLPTATERERRKQKAGSVVTRRSLRITTARTAGVDSTKSLNHTQLIGTFRWTSMCASLLASSSFWIFFSTSHSRRIHLGTLLLLRFS